MRRIALFALSISFASSLFAADSVRSLVDGGVLQELRWPNVSDYKRHLDSFYRGRNDALAWTRDGQPTEQALALTKVFAAADSKGINAVDYDADRWPAWMGAIAKRADAESLARLDVEMTATLMRYISDLHTGRVNPRHVDYFVDITAKKYDLPK